MPQLSFFPLQRNIFDLFSTLSKLFVHLIKKVIAVLSYFVFSISGGFRMSFLHVWYLLVQKIFIISLNLEIMLKRLFYFSMTGEQIPAPSSPRDGEDVSITLERPKVPNCCKHC